MGFPRQEYWSGLPFPSPEDLPDLGIKPWSPTWEADSLPSEPLGKCFTHLYFSPFPSISNLSDLIPTCSSSLVHRVEHCPLREQFSEPFWGSLPQGSLKFPTWLPVMLYLFQLYTAALTCEWGEQVFSVSWFHCKESLQLFKKFSVWFPRETEARFRIKLAPHAYHKFYSHI